MNVLQRNIEPYYAEKKLNYSHRMTVFSLYSQVNFDNQSLQKVRWIISLFSILGGILSSVKAHFAQQRADIVEMEGKFGSTSPIL